ncbi:MAG: hypothetical protein AB1400_06190 [Pseudomonadota bacterium]
MLIKTDSSSNSADESHELSSQKRRVNGLLNDLRTARERWLESVLENLILTRTASGNHSSRNKKCLYVARDGDWWERVKLDISKFENRIREVAPNAKSRPRSLWVPAYIENPKQVSLRVYTAISTRGLSHSQARAFAKKLQHKEHLPSHFEYKARSITGRNYKLRVSYGKNCRVCTIGFSEWVVCICRDEKSVPRLRKRKNMSPFRNMRSNDAVCSTDTAQLIRGNSKLRKKE